MKTPKTLYILIAIFCVLAVITGIYAQFIEGKTKNKDSNNNENLVAEKESQATIKEEFSKLFTNTVNLNGLDTTGITKLNNNQEIIYQLDKTESTDAYEIDVHIPIINIKSNDATSFNKATQTVFANKANEVLKKTDTTNKTLYTIDYVAYVNEDILSIVIKSTLKEGNSAQRVIVQTYNYNLTTGEKVDLNGLITKKALNRDDVSKKIRDVVQAADEESKLVASAGYGEIFTRDLANQMYTIEKSGTVFLGDNKRLYVIYAYGNQNFTSEMDIVLFE